MRGVILIKIIYNFMCTISELSLDWLLLCTASLATEHTCRTCTRDSAGNGLS